MLRRFWWKLFLIAAYTIQLSTVVWLVGWVSYHWCLHWTKMFFQKIVALTSTRMYSTCVSLNQPSKAHGFEKLVSFVTWPFNWLTKLLIRYFYSSIRLTELRNLNGIRKISDQRVVQTIKPSEFLKIFLIYVFIVQSKFHIIFGISFWWTEKSNKENSMHRRRSFKHK